ncbi:MAG: sigma factor-like helix-turn-helix DNA-binding protein [Candidatus Gracilibacteria bacterium]
MSSQIQNDSSQKLDLTKILEDIFLVLTPKEKEVIIKRFSLNNEPKQTLEKIGQQFSVTRERIRQIEKIALSKLRRTLENTKLSEISRLAREILSGRGNLCVENELVSEVLKGIYSSSEVDAHISKLALAISHDFTYGEKNGLFHPFWMTKSIAESELIEVSELAHTLLLKKKDVVPTAELVIELELQLKEKGKTFAKETLHSLMAIDVRFKRVKEGIGLMSWRHINPKSIRDKAYIVLKRGGKPMHFVEIANKITESGFDKKLVTTQAVHNELIRDEHFVLVGRGLYGLKEWGYKKGTVSEVIEDLLRKKSPMSKQEIIAGVLKQRQVKKGTISLNLQKNAQFVRVGRAVYSLDESKKVAA